MIRATQQPILKSGLAESLSLPIYLMEQTNSKILPLMLMLLLVSIRYSYELVLYDDIHLHISQAELATIVKAMKRIEEKTCIRFHRIDPTPGKNWLLLMRVGNKVNGEKICHADYIHENLKDKTYGDLGKVCMVTGMPTKF